MSNIALTFRDRLALLKGAAVGSFPTDKDSVGGKLLHGVISPGGTPPTRGTREYLGAYSKMPWLRAVCSRVSHDVAAVEWKLYVERRNGKPVRNAMLQRASGVRRELLLKSAIESQDVEEVGVHAMLDLMDNANTMQTGLQMRRVTQQHVDLVGEAFWLVERGALNQPVAVWPVPPHWILGTPTPRRPVYRVSFKGWQGEIPETEIVWFQDVDPLNPYGRGTGTAQSLSDELETDEYAAKHTRAFFYNRARPDLIVSPKGGGTMTEPDVERLEEQWTAANQGFWRAFKPFFLRREVEIKELDTGNFRTQQMVPLREFERDTILQVYGVSPETLGILGAGSNRATVTMGDTIYTKRVLVPRLEMIRSVLQERLVPQFDERLILGYVSPVTKDHEMELAAAKAAPHTLSVDEWREKQGLPPLEKDKGKVFVGSPMLTVIDYEAGGPVPPAPTPPSDDPDVDDDDDPDLDEDDVE